MTSAEQELAELLGFRSMSAHFASAFGFRSASSEDNDGDDRGNDLEEQLWNPPPPPELHEGVEVAWEAGERRCVATNTTHVGDCLRPARKSRIKQWRRAARYWRLK